MGVLPDGRVLLRDPGNARINVYSPGGETLDHWDLRGGYFTSSPLVVDTVGNSYTHIWDVDAAGDRTRGCRISRRRAWRWILSSRRGGTIPRPS